MSGLRPSMSLMRRTKLPPPARIHVYPNGSESNGGNAEMTLLRVSDCRFLLPSDWSISILHSSTPISDVDAVPLQLNLASEGEAVSGRA